MLSWKLDSPPPVEHRMLGLDRRLIGPTIGVYLVVALWSTLMPAIDEAVQNHVIEVGTLYDVGPASFKPATGWVLIQPPSPVGTSTSATVFKDGVTFRVKGGQWNKSARDLLAELDNNQQEFFVSGREVPISTAQDVRGFAKRINGPDFTGLMAVYVSENKSAVEVVVRGAVDSSEQLSQPIAEMIQSIVFEPGAGRP